nr:hypothetical protein [uncultured Holophaga sp.]
MLNNTLHPGRDHHPMPPLPSPCHGQLAFQAAHLPTRDRGFDPQRNHRISREEALDLVLNFQARPEALRHSASAYARSAFEQLLGQPEAAGIRIYLAEHADGSPTMVMGAVDAAGADLDGTLNLWMQNTIDCPPICKWAILAKRGLRPELMASPNGEFDIHRNHLISREEAADLALRHQARPEAGEHYASAYARSAFKELLAQPEAVGIRIYRAEHDDGSPTMVMVAIDKQGIDMASPENLFMQNSADCPPVCKDARLAKR